MSTTDQQKLAELRAQSQITPTKGALMRLIKEYLSYRPWLTVLIIVGIILSCFSSIGSSIVILPIVNKVNDVYSGLITVEEYLSETVQPCVIFLVVVYAVGLIAMTTYTVGMAWLGQSFMTELRNRLFDHMESLPISFFDRNQKGDIMSVYTNDIEGTRQFIIQSLQSFLTCSLNLLFLVAMMLTYSIFLMLISAAAIAAMLVTSKLMGRRSSKHYDDVQHWVGIQEGLIEEMMGGMKVVKSFNHERKAREAFDRVNNALCDSSIRANILSFTLGPILNHIGVIAYVLIAVVGCAVASAGGMNFGFMEMWAPMNLGIVLAFIPLAQQTTGNVNQLGQQFPYFAMSAAGAGRIYSVMDKKPEVDEGYVTLVRGVFNPDGSFQLHETAQPGDTWAWRHEHQADHTVTYVPLKGDIVLQGVDFSYEPGKQVLRDVSVYAKPGQKVALVGATGAGKTTITNLLNRFYDIEDGKIRYDGININKIKKRDLRLSLGMVIQDTSLFTGTVMDNIRYGRLDATDEECIAAAKLANADGFIRMLPEGYNTVIEGDGSSLSQGQCQLLSIARVAVANPPVLILDEATSSIDTRTEAIVTDGMDKLMDGRTTFAIAHRLSTIRNSNVIIVMDHGRIIERGTHEQLLAQKGVYFQLYSGTTELE